MTLFLVLASLVMLVSAEPPTSYSHRSSGPVSFQPVPSVAQIHIPSTQSAASAQSASYASASQTSPSYAAPQSSYGSPSQSSYGSPSQSSSYGSPSQSSSQYQSPVRSQQQYNSPPQQQQQQQQQQYSQPQQQQYLAQQSHQQNQYAAPSSHYQSQSHPANIQVSYGGVPPQLPPGASFGPPPVVTGAGPDHDIEYRVVYVKGPKARQPDLVLPPPPPKQKTIVYILVPRVEAPEPIIVPTHAPTPPSKPEVYFIRYKAAKKNRGGSNSIPLGQYGAPSAPKPVVVDAPTNKKREVEVSVTSSSSKETKDAEFPVTFGDRVRSSE